MGWPHIHNEESGPAHLTRNRSRASTETGRSRRPSPVHAGFQAASPREGYHLPEHDSEDTMGSPSVAPSGVLQLSDHMSDD
eukprot:7549572-Pyramimonas_sp.AAC.1